MHRRATAAALALLVPASVAPALALSSSEAVAVAVAQSSPSARTHGAARQGPDGPDRPEVTRTGTVHRVVTTTGKRETVSTVLRSAGRTIPLRGAGLLEPGRQSVTGVMDAGGIHVTSASPDPSAPAASLGARAATSADRGTVRPVQGRERSLVLPVKYDSGAIRPGDYAFAEHLGFTVGSKLRLMSGGRYSLRGTIAPWLVLPQGQVCGADRFDVLRRARAAARARGIDVASFDRFLVYLRCAGQSSAEALTPGTVSWYYGRIGTRMAVHELGHNFGLLHASSLACRRERAHSLYRGRCRTDTYGDYQDVMGEGELRVGFNAAHLSGLGWPSDHVAAARTGTWQLRGTQNAARPGLEALRIPGADGTSYWVQVYRPSDGVYLRRQKDDGSTELLSAHDHWYLGDSVRPGTSVTTPDGVRISVSPRASGAPEDPVSVEVDHDAPPPSAPGSPERVRVTQVSHQTVRIAFDAPLTDNGAPVHHYVVSIPGQEGIDVGEEPEDPDHRGARPGVGRRRRSGHVGLLGPDGAGADPRRGRRGQRVRRVGGGSLRELHADRP